VSNINISDAKEILKQFSSEQKTIFDDLFMKDIWVPTFGRQKEAFLSEADILFYGGSAGGGKTDLLLGTAITRHQKGIVFRKQATQLTGIIDRLKDIFNSDEGFNRTELIWRLPGWQLELGSCKDDGDEEKYQGRPHDFIGFDEVTHFPEKQFRYLTTWLRTTMSAQRCRIICTGNPPTSSDGDWVRKYWGPWLNPDHPKPAMSGELRWYTTIDGEDIECDGPNPFKRKGKTYRPQSRSFISSRVTDNPFLADSNYVSTLQALPEPLRSQMLYGDFSVGTDADPWQVIPTEWVMKAQERWEDNIPGPLDCLGVDPARGGRDETVIARRYGTWFNRLKCYAGKNTPDGASVATLVIQLLKDKAPIHVDVIGIGSSVYDHMKGTGVHVIPVNSAEKTKQMDSTRTLRMSNKRAALWWNMREALDPKNDHPISLPPDQGLREDLCSCRWSLTPSGIQIEKKEDVKKRIGRSPDKGDAIVLANIKTYKRTAFGNLKTPRFGRRGAGWMGL
jgi:hypothetical protein